MTETPVASTKFRLAAHQLRQAASLELTAAQALVAALPASSVRLVYGAPATGKTTAARALVLQLAREGGPEQVLALAASRESANLLRDELALEFQGSTPGPFARTISSLAFTLLRQAALAEGLKEPELISGPEQDRILKDVLAPYAIADGVAFGSQSFRERTAALGELGFSKFVTAQVVALRGFRAELRDLIAVCQEHQIDPDALASLGLQHDIPVWVGAAEVYRSYLQRLREAAFENRHDSATLLNTAQRFVSDLSALSSAQRVPAILEDLKTIVVDDAQELTQGAARLLRAIAERGVGLVLVGDPDAAVLGFRAADPRAMRELADGLGATGAPIALTPIPGLLAAGMRSALQPVIARLGSELGGLQRAGVQQQAAGARELDVVGAQHLQHLSPNQPHDQGELKDRQCHRWKHNVVPALGREQATRPKAHLHHLPTAKTGEPTQHHGKNQDQQNTDQKGRQRHAQQRDRHDELTGPSASAQGGVDAHGNANEQSQ